MIYRAKLVIPVDRPPISGGALAVHGGRIMSVGGFEDVRDRFPKDRIVDYEDAVIVPGLVNAHSHIELEALSDLPRPSSFAGWLGSVVDRSRGMTEEGWRESARRGARRLVEGGVTATGDVSRWGAGAVALKEEGLHGVAFHEVVAVDDRKFSEALEDLLERMGSFKRGGGLMVGISPHAPYSVSGSVIRKLGRLADSMGLPLSVHVAETTDEVKMISRGSGALSALFRALIRTEIPLKGTGKTPVAYLDGLDALGPRTLAVHCVHVTSEDVAILWKRGAGLAICPTSNEWLDVGEAPIAEIIKSRVRFAPGTDSAASNPHMDLFEEMRAVMRISERQENRPMIDSRRDALSKITLEAASILGLDSEIGSLTAGKWADFAVLKAPDGSCDETDVVSWASRKDVIATVLSGRPAYSLT